MGALKTCGRCHGKGTRRVLLFRRDCGRCGGLGQEFKLSHRIWSRIRHGKSEVS
jgi:DnaJ-class molecular chaperone